MVDNFCRNIPIHNCSGNFSWNCHPAFYFRNGSIIGSPYTQISRGIWLIGYTGWCGLTFCQIFLMAGIRYRHLVFFQIIWSTVVILVIRPHCISCTVRIHGHQILYILWLDHSGCCWSFFRNDGLIGFIHCPACKYYFHRLVSHLLGGMAHCACCCQCCGGSENMCRASRCISSSVGIIG